MADPIKYYRVENVFVVSDGSGGYAVITDAGTVKRRLSAEQFQATLDGGGATEITEDQISSYTSDPGVIKSKAKQQQPGNDPKKAKTESAEAPTQATSSSSSKYAPDEYQKAAKALGYSDINAASKALGVPADTLVKNVNPNANLASGPTVGEATVTTPQGTSTAFYIDSQTGQQVSAAEMVPGRSYVESGTGKQVVGGQQAVVDTSIPPPGVTQDEWNKLDPGTQAALSAIQGVLQQQLDQNQQVPVALTDQDLDALFKQAQNDPVIKNYYGERLRTGTDAFMHDLAYLQGNTDSAVKKQAQQFEDERRALAEKHSAAGTAYSGFRGQAQEKLASEQGGIVESARRTLKKNLDDAARTFAMKYGSANTPNTTIAYNDPLASQNYSGSGLYLPSKPVDPFQFQGDMMMGLAGSEASERLSDVETKYQDLQRKSLQQAGATQ